MSLKLVWVDGNEMVYRGAGIVRSVGMGQDGETDEVQEVKWSFNNSVHVTMDGEVILDGAVTAFRYQPDAEWMIFWIHTKNED